MRVFPFPELVMEERSSQGLKCEPIFAFDVDLIEALDEFLKPWNLSGDILEFKLSITLAHEKVPWCIILLPRELRLAGHIAQSRLPDASCCKFTSYRFVSGYVLKPGEIPTVSIMLLRDKEALRALGLKSPVFASVAEVMENMSETGNWLILSDLPDEVWLTQAEAADAERYVRLTR